MFQNCGSADKLRWQEVFTKLALLSCRSDGSVCLTRQNGRNTGTSGRHCDCCAGGRGHMPILRGTNSALLPCGCLIGIYETYQGTAVAIVDAEGSYCADRSHRVNARVSWNAQP